MTFTVIRLRRAFCASILAILAATPPAGAQAPKPRIVKPGPVIPRGYASATVPLNDAVYLDLDRLDALGLLPREVLSHRPLSRAEVARIVEKASLTEGAVHQPARDILIRLRKEYPVLRAGEDQGFERITIGATGTNSEPQRILEDNHVGSIDGVIDPLFGYREGDVFAVGTTGWLEARHSVTLGPHLAIGSRVDMRAMVGSGNAYPFRDGGDVEHTGLDADAKARFDALYGRFRFGQFVVEVGRDALAMGPAPVGGILLSNNARPLDMILATHESSYRLPWIFRHLGPQRIAVAVADLGGDRVPKHPFLVVTRGTFRLHRRLELGVWDTLVLGGEGSPKPSVVEILHEIFPFGRHGYDADLSDHRIAFDLRAHVIPGRLLLYHEAFLEDGFRPAPWGDMWDVMPFRTGLYTPAIGPHGRCDARFEVTRIPAIAYRHGHWKSGYTLDERLLGDELGPDSWGIRTAGRWNRPDGNFVSGELAYENRNADLWSQEPTANPDRFGDIFRAEDFPTESRVRARLGMDWTIGPGLEWQPRIGAERVFNSGFTKDRDRTNFMVELAFTLDFGQAKVP